MRLLCAGDCHEHAGEQDMCGLSRKVDGLSYKADGLIREAYFKQRSGKLFRCHGDKCFEDSSSGLVLSEGLLWEVTCQY